MQYIVYILYSEKDHNFYTGCTNNIERRLIAHNSGRVSATQTRRPLRLIHEEVFRDKAQAFNRERFLKSLWGSQFKENVRKAYLESRTKSP
jgi:putative endonuclease